MGFTRDSYLALSDYGEVPQMPGHKHDRVYEATYFVASNNRGFLHLSSPNPKDPTRNDYFAYETGLSSISAEIRDGGTSTQKQVDAFKSGYLANMKIQEDRLNFLDPAKYKNPELSETFEVVVGKLLELSNVATPAARLKHITPAPEPAA